VLKWLSFVQNRLAVLKGIEVSPLVTMPHELTSDVRQAALALLDPWGPAHLFEMKPPGLGTGDIFRGAMDAGFRLAVNPPVDYVMHCPADVDYGKEQPDDVQARLPKMLEALTTGAPPDLVIGDYTPMRLDAAGQPAGSNVLKAAIEEHVLEQMDFFFPKHLARHHQISRPRSEFFIIGRALFGMADRQHHLFLPYDPIPQLLIFMDKDKGNRPWRLQKIDLGHFYERSSYSPKTVADQVIRTTEQLGRAWRWWKQQTEGSIADVQQWPAELTESWRKAFEKLTQILPLCPVVHP
jgi:hypothetical protein